MKNQGQIFNEEDSVHVLDVSNNLAAPLLGGHEEESEMVHINRDNAKVGKASGGEVKEAGKKPSEANHLDRETK